MNGVYYLFRSFPLFVIHILVQGDITYLHNIC